jgi:WD40 repeat protein
MSPDGSMFATGGYDFLVRIWEIESKTVTANLSGHSQKVMGVAFSADCVLLASGSHDNTVKLWEV